MKKPISDDTRLVLAKRLQDLLNRSGAEMRLTDQQLILHVISVLDGK